MRADPSTVAGPAGPQLSRRRVLRGLGVAGAAVAVPGLLSACKPTPPPLAPDPSVRGLGFVGGPELEVGQGGWCWFQSPRASFGPGGVLWLGTTVANTFTDADGDVVVTSVDTGAMALRSRLVVGHERPDDHTSPSVVVLGDRVQVAWGPHRLADHLDIGQLTFDGALDLQRVHRPNSVRIPGRGTSYASVHVVGGQRWLLYRGEGFTWNLLTSPDGTTWTGRGAVVLPALGGQRPYLSAASDGSRLHLVVSDGNPTEAPGCSVSAASIDASYVVRNSAGATIGTVGSGAPTTADCTRLVTGVAAASDAGDTDAWTCDLRIVDNRPTGILSVREPWPEGSDAVGAFRHRYVWIRQRPSGWLVQDLCWAGGELYGAQPDYTGLASQDPSDPRRVVVSTNVDPVAGTPLVSASDGLVHWELFEGYLQQSGAWTWTPLTSDSTEDNLRPVIAAGGTGKALAWMRGRYWSWTAFDTRIVVRRAA